MVVAAADLFELPEWATLGDAALRLVAAAVLGGLIGWERESKNRAAGLRTHILVAVGSAIFVLAADLTGISEDARSRVIQGVVSGIGFLGAGTIIKLTDKAEVKGLTTAASIFATAAIGVAAACSALWFPLLGTAIALFTLRPLQRVEPGARTNTNENQNVTSG